MKTNFTNEEAKKIGGKLGIDWTKFTCWEGYISTVRGCGSVSDIIRSRLYF